MSDHAYIAPSSLARIVQCPGSVALCATLPDEPDGIEAQEGTAAHWVADQYADGNEVEFGSSIPTPGNFTVDHDMIHGARLWASTVGYGSVPPFPVASTRIHPADCWGTPDRWRWDPIVNRLRVWDYKYGFGLIEAKGFWQGIAYAAALLESFELMHDPDVGVDISIIQPRAYHPDGPVRTWQTTVGELRVWINQARAAAHEALPPPNSGYDGRVPSTNTGPECLHCPAAKAGICTTLSAAATKVTEWAGAIDPLRMDERALGIHAQILEQGATLLEAMRTGIMAQIEALLRGGKSVPGWKMTPGRSNLIWNDGTAPTTVQMMAGNVNVMKPPTLITPTQAKVAGVSEDIIALLAHRPPAALKLVQDDGSEATKVFGGI